MDSKDDALTVQGDWDAVHSAQETRFLSRVQRLVFGRRVDALFKRGGLAMEAFIEQILAKYLGKEEGGRFLEVGCAPARMLGVLQGRFQFDAYGMDYSLVGVEQARMHFKRIGLPAENIMLGDLLDDASVCAHEGRFDTVMSFGLIEHFEDPRAIVKRHVTMLRRSGLLIIVVPNLRGVYGPLVRVLNPRVLPQHNLEIMSLGSFRETFDDCDVDALLCGYVGPLSSIVLNSDSMIIRRALLFMIRVMERPYQVMRWALCGSKFISSRWVSPYLVFVGRKR
ncbi:MAG: class I SAM-dependent methyltransferase [Planctomycetota bacterium]